MVRKIEKPSVKLSRKWMRADRRHPANLCAICCKPEKKTWGRARKKREEI